MTFPRNGTAVTLYDNNENTLKLLTVQKMTKQLLALLHKTAKIAL